MLIYINFSFGFLGLDKVLIKNLFENNFETNDSDITFIKRRFDATACIIFKL
jgi:hypothetical protein